MTSPPADGARRLVGSIRPVFGGHWHWIVAAQFSAVLGTLALLKLVANLASPADFGRFAVILAVAGAVNTLAFGPVAAWASRHYQEAREARLMSSYRRALLLAVGAGAFASVIVAWLLTALFGERLAAVGLAGGTIVLGIALGLATSAGDLGVAVANAALRRRRAAFFLAAGRWLPVAAILVAHAFLGARSVESYAIAAAGTAGVLVAVQVAAFTLDGAGRGEPADWRFLRSLVGYSSPYFAWGVPSYLITFGDRLLLAYFTSPATVGTYAAMATATTNAANVATAAVNRVLEPTVFRIAGAGDEAARRAEGHRLVDTTTLVLVAASLPILALYAAFPEPVIGVFAASEYADFPGLLWLLLLASVTFFAGQQLILHGMIEKRPWIYLPAKFAHAAILVAGIVWLVPANGLPGLVAVLVGCNAAQLGLVLLTNRAMLRR